MTATTAQYLELSNLYRSKAEADVAAVQRHVHALLESLGRGKDEIASKTVRLFCSNARNLRYDRRREHREHIGVCDTLKNKIVSRVHGDVCHHAPRAVPAKMSTDVCTYRVCLHRFVRFRSLAEDTGATRALASLKQQLQGEDSAATASMHILLRATDRFKQEHKRFPGALEHECVCLCSLSIQCSLSMQCNLSIY